MKKLYWSSFLYLLLGLSAGVFYREFTKFHDFTGQTQLSTLHTHLLSLGMLLFLLFLAIEHQFSFLAHKSAKAWFVFHHVSFLGVIITMTTRGVLQVLAKDMAGLNHIAGSFHTLLAISFIWFFMLLKKSMSPQK